MRNRCPLRLEGQTERDPTPDRIGKAGRSSRSPQMNGARVSELVVPEFAQQRTVGQKRAQRPLLVNRQRKADREVEVVRT